MKEDNKILHQQVKEGEESVLKPSTPTICLKKHGKCYKQIIIDDIKPKITFLFI